MSIRFAIWAVAAGALALAAAVSMLLVRWLLPEAGSTLYLALAGVHLAMVLAASAVLRALWHRARRQVQALVEHLQDVGLGRFALRKAPEAVELQPLSSALNVATERLRGLFAEREQRIGALSDHVQVDPVTGLASRVQFEDRLASVLASASADQTGTVALVRVDDLIGLNRRLGRERADELLRAMGALLRLRLGAFGPDAVAARLNGGEFGLLAPGVNSTTFAVSLSSLVRGLDAIRNDMLTDRPQAAWIGATTFVGGEAPDEVMSRADAMLQACEQARAPWKLTTAGHSLHTVSVNEWRMVIETALETGRVHMQTFDVLTEDFRLVHREAVLRLTLRDGRVVNGEDVLPAATRTGRTGDLDLRMVGLALQHIESEQVPVSVNLSPQSVVRPAFLSRLAMMLDAAGPSASLLAVEVDEAVLLNGRDDLKRLSDLLSGHGVRLGLDHCFGQIGALSGLGALKVHYVKLDARRVAAIGGAGEGVGFVEVCRSVCRAEGMKLIACGVDDEALFAEVRRLQLDGYTGRAMRGRVPEAIGSLRAAALTD